MQTFGYTPRIPTATHFASVNLDDCISTDHGERNATSQLPERLGVLLLLQRFREVVDLDLVLGDLVENLRNIVTLVEHHLKTQTNKDEPAS